ncbi:MAG TPA: DUF4215 domain-containing protein [Kofleriaceae bacterium]
MSTALLITTMAGSAVAGPLVISEFRVRGPNGANDEFIEIYNQNASPHTVAATSGTGYGVAASDGVTRGTIPNGTVIAGHGHYLIVNSVGYSLASYPAGNGTTASGDATYTTDIPDNAGVALFNNNVGGGSYTLANRMDAVGSTSEANTLYKEGAGYPALTPLSIDYAFHRDACGKAGSITAIGDCPSAGALTDTDNNAADFIFVDTNGTSAGAGQRLGAPGPENLSSPVTGGADLAAASLDTCSDGITSPNRVRDLTSDPANNSTFGTLDLRQTFTNNTGGSLTRLRFRIVDLTTFPAPSGYADLRPRTSAAISASVDRPPCGTGTSNVTVAGTTLEQPASQPNGGGFNSTLSVGTVTLAQPLAAGASVDVRFLLGIQQTGRYKLGLVPEALPQAGLAAGVLMFDGCTDGSCPSVTIDQAAGQADPTSSSTVSFTAVFSTAVTGFDASDVVLGGTAGATTAVVTGGPTTYNITVSGMTTSGTVTATIKSGAAQDSSNVPTVASTSTDNTVTINFDVTPPTVTIDQDAGQADPAETSPIHFTVVFSEPVTGFDASDVTLGGTAGATTAVVTGGPTTYDVAVSGVTTNGTVTASIAAGAASDGAANPSEASTSTDNTVTFDGFDLTSPTVTADRATDQAASTAASPVHFTVVFSEAVTGFDADDVVVGGTAGATTAVVTGGPTTYDVAVSGMTANGTVSITISAGAAMDSSENASLASTSTGATVAFTGFDAGAPVCGDGIVQDGEQCDDGNDVAGDGCTSCHIVPDPDIDGGGCGCSSAPDAGGASLFALAVGALLIPRRRRPARAA